MTAAGTRSKAEWRQRMREQRTRLDPDWAAEASHAITERALALPELAGATTVAAYLALPGEPHLDTLIAQLQTDGKSVYVPADDEDQGGYRLCHLHNVSSPAHTEVGRVLRTSRPETLPPGLVIGRFGVREPSQPQWADAVSPDLWLVPGVAFDRSGQRLGHGAGYYDRMLADAPGTRVGIAFAFQVLDAVAAEAHDVGMNLVITEQETIRV